MRRVTAGALSNTKLSFRQFYNTGRCVIIPKHIKIARRLREFWMIGKGLTTTRHAILAHIVPMRRCNLSCTYCNEYDDFSAPVPESLMLQRVDHLATLGLTVLVISGGEPLMHPGLDNIISRARNTASWPASSQTATC